MITREFLEQHIQQINLQIAAYTGAKEFAEMLLKEFDGPLPPTETMTLAELQAAIERGARPDETSHEQEYQQTHQTGQEA